MKPYRESRESPSSSLKTSDKRQRSPVEEVLKPSYSKKDFKRLKLLFFLEGEKKHKRTCSKGL